jgi:hypothetical protein
MATMNKDKRLLSIRLFFVVAAVLAAAGSAFPQTTEPILRVEVGTLLLCLLTPGP